MPTEIALYILNQKRESLVEIENRHDFHVRIDGDSTLISQEMKIERINTKSSVQDKSQTIREATQNENNFDLVDKTKKIEKPEKEKVRKRRPRRKRKNETPLQKTEAKTANEKLTENKTTTEQNSVETETK